ncbi:MAG TPA: hypothetical protein VD794_02210 [Flavisolibacter sp.]|nr:hypothetical protein [Flavisolibacter sp.]
MAKSNVVTYECQGTLNWKDESGIHNVNASAEDIYGWILNSVGEESRPFLVKEKYIDRSNHLTAQALERSKG